MPYRILNKGLDDHSGYFEKIGLQVRQNLNLIIKFIIQPLLLQQNIFLQHADFLI